MSPPTFKRVEKANPLLYGGEQGHIAREPVGWVTQLFQRALTTGSSYAPSPLTPPGLAQVHTQSVLVAAPGTVGAREC